ncbi:DinB family protein [Actinoplanes sp. NPDC026623]|uniref:DinB family protein n=1 Tax=Actinoplanes sp. NPDC026623 TaxID=3155610 RepID=UPI0033F56C73
MTGIDVEKATLHEFLAYQRASVRAIISGLSDDVLRTPVLPSGWTPLGLVEHLAHAEGHWFQEVTTGLAQVLPWPGGDCPPLTTPRSSAVVLEFYREQCALSDKFITATSLATEPFGRHHDEPLASQTTDLRRIILHMIEETARHAGHLDAARELIDGRTGLGPR